MGGAWACQRVPEDGSRLAVMEAADICMMMWTQRRLDRQKRVDLVGDTPPPFPAPPPGGGAEKLPGRLDSVEELSTGSG